VWGGEQLRDFTYVDDAVDALVLAAARDSANGHVLNLGGDRVINLQDLAALLIQANGGGEYVVKEFPRDRKRIDIGDYYADYGLIQSTLGWQPQVPLPEALRRTVEYYREHLGRYI
jgi:nucleoside-diphosphate-sugar epimerase